MAGEIEIGLVLYPGVQQAAVHGLTDLFSVADRTSARRGENGTARLRCVPWQANAAATTPAALILPPSLEEPPSPSLATPFIDGLRACHHGGTMLGSVCAGAFLLAETGLLAGRPATTHWVYADSFRERFPEVRLDTGRLIIDDGDIVTAGGVMAWIDLGLTLVGRFLGPAVMIDTARLLLVDPPGREQRYYSVFSPRLTHGDAAILKVQHWLRTSGAKNTALATMAGLAGLEERTFLRRFRKATGLTATAYAQHVRIGRAREMLQFSRLSVERIAWEVGYDDSGAFRKIFVRITGLNPGAYRQRFNPGAPMGEDGSPNLS